MKLYTFTRSELEIQCNNIRRMTVHKLYQKGLISKETYDDFMINYAFIVQKPSLFNTFWSGVLKQKDQNSYILVRQESFIDDMDETVDDDPKKNLKVINLDKHKKDN